jgi:methionyl-tRNA synthetase
MTKKFYITAAIPYVNAAPHIGHALEFVQVDALKRYHQLQGVDVISLSGGDENALKNVQAAEAKGIDIQSFVDTNTELFRLLAVKLNAEFDVWQKGSDKKNHYPSVQKLWNLCKKDIYKKTYEGLYCVGCEAFYTKEELNDQGECFEHPGKKLETVAEENYFFALSKYQNQLIKLIESDKLKITPETRKNEALSFLKNGLLDISVSRSIKRAKNWGVPVPDDPEQIIYVWFDALNIYQSGIGFGWDEVKYEKYWPADVHAIGKGISRFHTVYWPAFLLSAGLPLPKNIFVHGYLTVNGEKISKTVGNVIDPLPLIEKFGADPIRYYLLSKVSPFLDGDFSEKKLIESYNSDLANGLGNLVSRVAKLCEKVNFEVKPQTNAVFPEVTKAIGEYKFDETLKAIWQKISEVDKKINVDEPWKLEEKELKEALAFYVSQIKQIAYNLKPFLPETAEAIESIFAGPKVSIVKPLFPRI